MQNMALILDYSKLNINEPGVLIGIFIVLVWIVKSPFAKDIMRNALDIFGSRDRLVAALKEENEKLQTDLHRCQGSNQQLEKDGFKKDEELRKAREAYILALEHGSPRYQIIKKVQEDGQTNGTDDIGRQV